MGGGWAGWESRNREIEVGRGGGRREGRNEGGQGEEREEMKGGGEKRGKK